MELVHDSNSLKAVIEAAMVTHETVGYLGSGLS